MNQELIESIRGQAEIIPFEGLIDSGLLYWINDYAFHRHGRALELHLNDEGEAIGFRLVGDGMQKITHENATLKLRVPVVSAVMALGDGKPTLKWHGENLD